MRASRGLSPRMRGLIGIYAQPWRTWERDLAIRVWNERVAAEQRLALEGFAAS